MFTLNASADNNNSLLGNEEGGRTDSAQNYFDDPVGRNARKKDLNVNGEITGNFFRRTSTIWGCFFVTFVLIITLFGLVSSIDRNDSSSTYTVSEPSLITVQYSFTGSITQTNIGGSLILPVQPGSANELQAGAGITAYSTDYGSMQCPKYLNLIPLLQNDFMMTYESQQLSTYDIFDVPPSAPDTPSEIARSVGSPYDIYQAVTLDQSNGIFVFVPNHDDDPNTNDVYVVAGKLQSADSLDIIYSAAQQSYTSSPYPFPMITRMDNSMFALIYYDDTAIKTRFGSVDENLAIKLSNEVVVCNNTDYATNFYGTGLSASRYLVTCCEKCQSNVPNADSATLQGNMETHILDANIDSDGNLEVILSTDPSSNGVLASATGAGAIRTDRISDSAAVLVFVDADNAYALRGVLAQVINDPATGNPMVSYGASYTFSEGASLKKSCTTENGCVLMDFDIKTVSRNGYTAIVVLFADASNSYRITISGCMVNSVNNLVTLFEKMPLTSEVHSGSDYVWTAISSNNVGQISMVGVYSDSNCDNTVPIVTVLEIKPPPVGMITSVTSDKAIVTMKGSTLQLTDETSSFVAGNTILTSSMGDLIQGPPLGQIVDTYFATSSSFKTRVYDIKSSQVGIALDENSVLVDTYSI